MDVKVDLVGPAGGDDGFSQWFFKKYFKHSVEDTRIKKGELGSDNLRVSP